MARRKITESDSEPTAEKLPGLTPNQEKFVQALLDGKRTTDAYRAAYDCSNMLPNSIWREASLLSRHPKVAQWLSAAREACLGAANVTFEAHLQQLERIREIALRSGNVGAAVQAEQLRGKVAGHHVDQIRDVTERHDPAQTIREIAAHSPDLAAALAAANGIEFNPAEGLTKH
jgi:hypothetical protein